MKKQKNKELLPKNTYKKGRTRVFIYPEKNQFVAVCLDFGLVEVAESLNKAEEYIKDAVESHLKIVIKKRLSEDLLNRPAEEKHWKKYRDYLEREVLWASFKAGLKTRKPREDWTSLAILHTLKFSDSNIYPHLP